MMPQSVVELLVCWQVVFAINGMIICGWLPIAQSGPYGNNRCFEDTKRVMSDLKLIFFRTLLDCVSV